MDEDHDDYSLGEFEGLCDIMAFIDDDGSAEYLKDAKPTGVKVLPSNFDKDKAAAAGYSGVRWYNK